MEVTEKKCECGQQENCTGNCAQKEGGCCATKEGGSCCASGKGCTGHKGCAAGGCRSNKKLNVYDWLEDIPESHEDTDFVEVQFKNTRKGYFRNSNKIKLEKGDIVAVESNPGHDIGEVTLTGRLVLLQMKKNNVRVDNPDIRRVYRKAKPNDLEKYEEAKAKEHSTMLKARKIAENLHLNMKIGDVEYQGDGNKAIFYYIADDRVDFRQLIKVLAETFRVRIEMKQIGARQEAGRIGGIGPCGRELCCSGWMTSFVSVATSAARYQDISLNPQKLAGQCAKLKCCLNYEVDTYVEAQKQLPSREVVLSTKDAEYYHFKTDIHKRQISYSTSRDFAANIITIPAQRAFEIIALNKRGVRVDSLEGEIKQTTAPKEFTDVVGQDSLTRFDKAKKNQKKRKKGRKESENENPNPNVNPTAKEDRRRREDRPAREDRGPREERSSREDRAPRVDGSSRDERPSREDRPVREDRAPREDRGPREDRRKRDERPKFSKKGGSNGPDKNAEPVTANQEANKTTPSQQDRKERPVRRNRPQRPDKKKENNEKSAQQSNAPKAPQPAADSVQKQS